MSLLSLKKSKPSAKSTLHSVDSFIDDAVSYASGKNEHHRAAPLSVLAQVNAQAHRSPYEVSSKTCLKAVQCSESKRQHKGMRHATFTLTPECISQLSLLSQDSGLAKSAMIREWISTEFAKRQCADSQFTEKRFNEKSDTDGFDRSE
jgi:hypothetical protein